MTATHLETTHQRVKGNPLRVRRRLTSAGAAVAAASLVVLAGCSQEPQAAPNPLCGIVAPDSTAGNSLGAAEITSLKDYVAAIVSADPSLARQGEAATVALEQVQAQLSAAGGDPERFDPAGKSAVDDATDALRSLADAVAAATADGCPRQ